MVITAESQRTGSHAGTWTLLGALVVLCIAAVGFPIFIIRPFVRQAPLPLSLALLVQRWAPWFTLLGLLAGLLLVVRLWTAGIGKHKGLKRVCLLAATMVLALCTWAARINVYERMFRPLRNPGFVSAAQANLRAEDMVMAVSINGDERAYPVLQMAYHHLFDDVVGGIPILPTY